MGQHHRGHGFVPQKTRRACLRSHAAAHHECGRQQIRQNRRRRRLARSEKNQRLSLLTVLDSHRRSRRHQDAKIFHVPHTRRNRRPRTSAQRKTRSARCAQSARQSCDRPDPRTASNRRSHSSERNSFWRRTHRNFRSHLQRHRWRSSHQTDRARQTRRRRLAARRTARPLGAFAIKRPGPQRYRRRRHQYQQRPRSKRPARRQHQRSLVRKTSASPQRQTELRRDHCTMKLSLSAPLRLCAFALIFAIGCVHGPKQQRSSSQTAGFYSQKLAAIDEAIASAISSNKLPGGVLWIEHDDRSFHRAYGKRSVDPVEAMTEDTIFDAASLTKVVATTSAIMRLYERGQIDLEAPVSKYLPEFNWPKQQPITVRQLLTHVSGLRPDVSLTESWSGYNTGIHLALEEQPTTTPGTVFRYSDINFILLGEIVHRVSGKPLNEFSAYEIFEPLGMTHTGFLPKNPALVAPTTRETNGFVRGIVHDPTARRMDGVAGHAGLFITASDLRSEEHTSELQSPYVIS